MCVGYIEMERTGNTGIYSVAQKIGILFVLLII